MVQDQSEASSSRIITAFTMMSARMNMETMAKLPTTSPAGAAVVPGGAAKVWDWAAGPVGAAMGALCPPCANAAAGMATRIRKAAARCLIIEKTFWRQY